MATTIEMAEALKQIKRELTNRFFETTDDTEKHQIERELGPIDRIDLELASRVVDRHHNPRQDRHPVRARHEDVTAAECCLDS